MPRFTDAVRYTLRDRDLLRKIMKHPGCGTPHTVRSLAEAAKCSRGAIGKLLSGEQDAIAMNDAHAISEAVGVAVLVLFTPPTSPNRDKLSRSHASD